MCTVSIIPRPHQLGGYRLVTNRDEQRSRPPGEPPVWRTIGGVRAIAPRDPVAGGTWVATTQAGLTLCLLNGNLEPPPPPPARPRSRGLLIGDLIGGGSVDGVLGAMCTTDLSAYPPFRLVVVEPERGGQGVRVADAFWDGRSLTQTPAHDVPVCFVSSGLGDSRVVPRLPLFEQGVRGQPTAQAQDAFHRHAWADRPEISVCMWRGDARTVSITTIAVEATGPGSARVRVEHAQVPDVRPIPLAAGPGIG